MTPVEDPEIIKASPTKNFFISMLIRDLTLRDAIGDLVDNSVDGAKTLSTDKNYSGLEVRIEAKPEHFKIEDNCGGISVKVAREYAFRFGRPDEVQPIPGSVGQFGIGMKRALFKMGNVFKITSIADTSRFEMEVNVPLWATDKENWDFRFGSFSENLTEIPREKRGTKIIVTDLRKDVKEQFGNPRFIKELQEEIERENYFNIHNGLKIIINGHTLKAKTLELKKDDDIKTAFWSYDFQNGMIVEIYAGIGEPNQEEGGWYIFCNDRLILGPEQTEISGWGAGRGIGVAKYHHQFRRFRGYVFFQAKDSSLLPWNTTKNSMDLDSPSYKFVKQRMIEMMKPVISLLNQIKSERENDTPEEERPLELLINNASSVPFSLIKEEDKAEVFTYPDLPTVKRKGPDEYSIKYNMDKTSVDKVKKSLNVTSLKEVGERTFRYYYDLEVGD